MEKPTSGELDSILTLLGENAGRYGALPALLSLGRPPLSHAHLLAQVEENVAALKAIDIRSGDRVVVVLDNGPEMAIGFLSTAAICACAPLNPAYTPSEFDGAFSALRPTAVITSAGKLPVLGEIAARHGAAVFEMLARHEDGAGICTLECRSPPGRHSRSEQADIALLLQTSGTTSRPKQVGLTQANLLCSAENIMHSLELGPSDRCLNIMPLFHIHGLVAALLASLRAGASLVCCPGFQANRFLDWLSEFRPTWYTAVPTMHASIVARINRTGTELFSDHSLRFIRSCSAALPKRLMHDLEEVFGVPVLEAYGMTEASHQIACNPLPPAKRKPGSVGIATGPDITILDEEGRHLPPEAEGEIAIRGPSVIRGYLENTEASTESFTDGWFRTGDVGSIDLEGYVHIKARIKEIINRGGTKVSPYEVEEALLDHAAVAEAAVFPISDPWLGETVGAAVVLKKESNVTAAELRDFLSSHLADFKIPTRIVFLDEIPKSATGKLQRLSLPARLKKEIGAVPTSGAETDGQVDWLEKLLLSIWGRALRLEQIATDDNFFELGGDSLCATEVLLQVEQLIGLKLPLAALFEAPTVQDLAKLIADPGLAQVAQRVLPINGHGSRPPFFCVGGGTVFWRLAQRLGADQPFYSLIDPPESPSLSNTLEELASFHIASIRALQPEGPYFIGGWCIDGAVAYEIAQQLKAQGEKVGLLVLFDALNPGRWDKYPLPLRPILKMFDVIQTSMFHAKALRVVEANGYVTYVRERFSTLLRQSRYKVWLLRTRLDPKFGHQLQTHIATDFTHVVGYRYRPKPYSGPVLLFRRTQRPVGPGQDNSLGWADVVKEELTIVNVPGDHEDMFREPQVGTVAAQLSMFMRDPTGDVSKRSGEVSTENSLVHHARLTA